MAIAVLSALTRAVSWTTGMVDGLFEGLVKSGEGRERSPAQFVRLRRAFLGREQGAIAGMLGWPAVVCADASTWYYRFDDRAQQAIAIQFVKGRVGAVELIG